MSGELRELHGVQALTLRVDESDVGRGGATLSGRSLQFQRAARDRGGWNQVYQGEGLTEAPGIGRCSDVPDNLSIDEELGAMLDDIVVFGNDTEEPHFFLALEFEHGLLAARNIHEHAGAECPEFVRELPTIARGVFARVRDEDVVSKEGRNSVRKPDALLLRIGTRGDCHGILTLRERTELYHF